MENILSLEELRKHLVIDFTEDDDYILMLSRVAVQSIVSATHRSVEELKEMGGGDFPEPLRLAAMQLAAHFYRVREPVTSITQHAVPYTLDCLVKPFVKLGNDD